MSRPWREVEYVVVDLETTGLDLRHDTIASYGAVVIRDGRMIVAEDRYELVCTTCDMDPASVAVHTLRPADVADAPPLSEAVAVLQSLLDQRVLVAHAAWIEQAFLARAFGENTATLRSPIIDTAALARAAGRAPKNSRSEPDLEVLADELRLPVVSPHHALGDAITTAQVFLALAAQLGLRGYASARDFIDVTTGDRNLATSRV
jgi:DNA polymerase-3 subunit epsilon